MRFFAKSIILTVCCSAYIGNASSDVDVSAGERAYIKCTGCHAPNYNRTGPKHCGLIGRAAGSVDNFEYTQAMISSGIIWTSETLDEFLSSPFKMIPGTSMGFIGISSRRERQQLIAYLSHLDIENEQCN